jgi:EF hand
MNGTRKPKKSETLEVRLPHRVKRSLMDKAHAEGRSASEVVRDCIDSYLAGQPKESRSMLMTIWKPAAVIGGGCLAVLWAAAVPVPSQAKPNLKAVFETLDRDRDGKITMDEFMRNASDPAVEKMHHAHMTGADKATSARCTPKWRRWRIRSRRTKVFGRTSRSSTRTPMEPSHSGNSGTFTTR